MRKTMLLAAALVPAMAAAAPAKRAPIEYFRREGSIAPFSPAVRVGDMLYLSGMIGARPDGSFPDGIEAQGRQAMDNVGAVLRMAGSDWSHVFRCTVMLADMADWPAFNKVYVTYFAGRALPARSAFGANGLALGARVEVECQAFAPEPAGK